VGCNHHIAIPQFIAPEYGNYLLDLGDPLYSAGHNDGPVGANWWEELVEPPDTTEIEPGILGSELIVNGGAESGVPDPWWAHCGDSQPVRLEVVSVAQFGGLTVTPHSGNYFFLLDGSVTCTDGYAMASACQEWIPLDGNADAIDSGSAIFKLEGFYWLENDTLPPTWCPQLSFLIKIPILYTLHKDRD